MESIREYLIGVIAAALLCSLVSSLIEPKSTIGIAVKMMAGLLMLLAVVRPWVDIRPGNLLQWADDLAFDGSSFVMEGENAAKDFYKESILLRLEEYILAEGKALNCDLEVEICLRDDLPLPAQIRISGNASPYARQTLSNLLTERLGIKREDLIWT